MFYYYIDIFSISGGYGATIFNVIRGQGNSIEFPLTLGREFCGVLVQKGMNIDIPLGERVWGVVPVHQPSGAHAEYVTVPKHCVSLNVPHSYYFWNLLISFLDCKSSQKFK